MTARTVSIHIEHIDNEAWVKMPNYDELRPFFMNLVSDSNHWMFISSNGGLTAGRKNPEYCLFPYYTVDKIHELVHTTGNKALFRVSKDGKDHVWEPFSDSCHDTHKISRHLYKNTYGNKILFEEINHDLELVYRYQWNSSNNFGFVKRTSITNTSQTPQKISILDGIQNIMPQGVSSDLQVRASNLVDAYKRNELVEESGLGIYALSAIIVDKAEPSEALKANVAWSYGLSNPTYLLSSLQLDEFKRQPSVQQETDVKGEKGAYFVQTSIELKGNEEKNWAIVANVNLNHAQIIELNELIKSEENIEQLIKKDIDTGTDNLVRLVAGADGLQLTAKPFRDARHYSNVLYNIMRGGVFDENYQIEKHDFIAFLKNANKEVYNNGKDFLNELSDQFDKSELDQLLEDTHCPDLLRLSKEYLPLKFSRRHGDSSRPWNKFSINTHNELDGSKILDYEGNWRDIFQNWEALAHSYPDFIEGMIFKFLNASTFDGYNPYRVMKDGFDWEIIEPDDPWSYIGYWGDHQIIYLLKFLEFYHSHKPNGLSDLFELNQFVYAHVPYRIKSYADIIHDPKNTIDFDEESDRFVRQSIERLGSDGALLSSNTDPIHHVSFMEKILATVLSKVSNFIPEAGIWMNTQRPEWNDANNALVGNGVSMVTLYYLRRFLKFIEPIIAEASLENTTVSKELHGLFKAVLNVLTNHEHVLNGAISDEDRKHITDGLGEAGSIYRNKIYDHGFSGDKSEISLSELSNFVQLTLSYLEHAIRANKRDDNLYHAYNLMSISEEGISISYLDEMLEGQVAVLSSGYLSAKESLNVLDALRSSVLFREDQHSYLLYPNKSLPGFLDKNTIPEEAVKQSELLQKLVEDGDQSIISKDVLGDYHFNGSFTNEHDLREALDHLKTTQYASLVEYEEHIVLNVFEKVFNHKAFTGRSGTFFAYEGLGSIYWHMVSKLHLAVYEVCKDAAQKDTDTDILERLYSHFDEIRLGIGVHKSAEMYGAFSTDPYSHTPEHRGAQQPGMTGQVKEDILVRFGQLGLSVHKGLLEFSPFLMKDSEFLAEPETFKLMSLSQESYTLTIPSRSMGFTYCQVPITYSIANEDRVEVKYSNGTTTVFDHLSLDKQTSDHVFQRSGAVSHIHVSLQEKYLRKSATNMNQT